MIVRFLKLLVVLLVMVPAAALLLFGMYLVDEEKVS